VRKQLGNEKKTHCVIHFLLALIFSMQKHKVIPMVTFPIQGQHGLDPGRNQCLGEATEGNVQESVRLHRRREAAVHQNNRGQ
jgi:hypothetical protein